MKHLHFLKIILPLVGLLIIYGCGPSIYLAQDFPQIKTSHKIVAILPFDVNSTDKKLPKGITQEMLAEQQKKNGYSFQSDVYTYFLKQFSKNRYTVEFQDVDKTNALLNKAGVSYEDMKLKGKEELCKVLGVDAVISGKAVMDHPMSEGAAVAVAILVGAYGSTNKVDITVTIHNNGDGKLLWKYDYTAEGSVGSSTQEISKVLMNNVSRNFPYKR